MRPLLPQPKFHPPLLLKLVVVYGIAAFILLLCLLVLAFVVDEFKWYQRDFQRGGFSELMDSLGRDFWGLDSNFLGDFKSSMHSGIALIPFGLGGIVGVANYVFVRKRRSLAEMIQHSSEDPHS